MRNVFNNLDPNIQRRLRENAKKYDSVKSLIYRLRGASNRYQLNFDDVKDVIFWGIEDSRDVKVSEVYSALFK